MTTSTPPPVTLITDAGLETWLLFQQGIDLPAFAAYPLVASDEGRRLLTDYYRAYAAIALAHQAGVVLETATWRATPDWAATLGHDRAALASFIRAAVEVVAGVRSEWSSDQPFLIGGTVGPRGDGYVVDTAMSAEEASEYHAFQVGVMAAAGVDQVTAITMGYVGEAAGAALAAQRAGLPAVVSFTVETDGTLPSGQPLSAAIEETDQLTGGYPSHYMINCAHPTHFEHVLDGGDWTARVGGLRANASTLSHAELDVMETLDDGDPADLAARYVALRSSLPGLRVIGGCCGTDDRHVAAIAAAWHAS